MSGKRNTEENATNRSQPAPEACQILRNSGSYLTTHASFFSKLNSYNRTLTFLTVAVLLLWTPNNIYYLLVYVNGYWNVPYFAIQSAIVYTISWVNPILCYWALDKLRLAVDQTLFNPCVRQRSAKQD